MYSMPLFSRKKKVDIDEILQELTKRKEENYGIEIEEYKPKSRIEESKRENVENVVKLNEIKITVKIEGLEELINELKELKNIINDLIDVLEKQQEVESR